MSVSHSTFPNTSNDQPGPGATTTHSTSTHSASAAPPELQSTYDVLVVGGGPVGLFLACELRLAGVSVLVIEKENSNSAASLWKTAGLGTRGVPTAAVEAFYRRGLLGKLLDGKRATGFQKTGSFQFAGHFAGISLDGNKIDLSRFKYKLPGPGLMPGRTDMARIESTLSDRAVELGVTILRGHAVSGVTSNEKSVEIRWEGGASVQAAWVVGCDGGRSAIRKAAGFEFVGTEAELTGFSAVVELDDASKLKPGFQLLPTGLYIVVDAKQVAENARHVIVVDFDGAAFDRTQAFPLEHFQNVLQRTSETDVKVVKYHIGTTFTDRAKQVTNYRKGRIFLAGDAAHIHSPFGAQGLSTGIGDAMNLGWKLASVVNGTASEELLDTYSKERHPIAAGVLAWTRAQVNIMRPTPHGIASAGLIRGLMNTTDGANYFIERIWGINQRYELGDEHPLVGVSAPDFEFADGSRLADKMHQGRGLLIDFKGDEKLAQLTKQWTSSQIEYVSAQSANTIGLDSLFIRPDGIVAWVRDQEFAAAKGISEMESLKNAETALLRWLGTKYQ